jgi:hypothetical protein
MAKTLIVDACVAGDAGSKEPPPEICTRARAFLETMREAGHRLGLTPFLETEWRAHAGRFAQRWLLTMKVKRLVVSVPTDYQTASRARALQTTQTPKERAAMDKDWHLVEAALRADRTVASSDETVHRLLVRAARVIAQLRPIVWVNPSLEDLSAWLQTDAPEEPEKQLGVS